MSLEGYIPRKRVNIKGKGNRRKGTRARRRERASWKLPLPQSPPNNIPRYYTLPDYLTSVPWSYKPNPLREIIYYVPISALEVLLKSYINDKLKV